MYLHGLVEGTITGVTMDPVAAADVGRWNNNNVYI